MIVVCQRKMDRRPTQILSISFEVIMHRKCLLHSLSIVGARLEPNIIHLWIVSVVLLLPSKVVILLRILIILVKICRLGLLTQHVLVHCMAAMLSTFVQEDWIRYWPLSLAF